MVNEPYDLLWIPIMVPELKSLNHDPVQGLIRGFVRVLQIYKRMFGFSPWERGL